MEQGKLPETVLIIRTNNGNSAAPFKDVSREREACDLDLFQPAHLSVDINVCCGQSSENF